MGINWQPTAYPKKYEKSPLVIFTHQHFDEHSSGDNVTPQKKEFEAPLLAALPERVNGLSLQNIYLKLLNPFQLSKGASSLNGSAGFNGDSSDLMDGMSSDSGSNFQDIQLDDDP